MTESAVIELTKRTLKTALAALKQGQLVTANAAIAAGIDQGGEPLVLNEIFGLELAKSGRPKDAVPYFGQAFHLAPHDPARAANLIVALIDSGDLVGALEVYTKTPGLEDASDRLLGLRAYCLQQLERFEDAAAAYRRLVAQKPDDFETWNNLGNVLSSIGASDESIAALRRAFELQPNNGPVALNLSASLVAVGLVADAESVLETLLQRVPNDGRAWVELAAVAKLRGHGEESLRYLRLAIDQSPLESDLWLKLGIEFQDQLRFGDAEAAFRKAVALDPNLTEASLLLAFLLEHTNQTSELRRLSEDTANHASDQNLVKLLQAMVHWRDKRYQEGLETISTISTEFEPVRTTQLKAQFLDRLGRVDEAFQSYTVVNEIHKNDPANPQEKARLHRVQLVEQLSLVNDKWLDSWTPAHPHHDRGPVFLVGFPRSGTTLLDTVLMGHPSVAVLEERPTITAVEQGLGSTDCLAQLGPDYIDELKRAYFKEVGRWIPDLAGQLLIDKSPLYLNKVPHIMRMFPDARFILALRHPLDVILSCYITNFRLNSGMSNFLSLDTSAEMYHLTFSSWRNSFEVFKPDTYCIRYEDLIADKEATIRPLINWLGLEWQDDILDHQTTALTRGAINTASYSQVTEPIYARSLGRWERYKDHLAPVIPIIRPWAERFGYRI